VTQAPDAEALLLVLQALGTEATAALERCKTEVVDGLQDYRSSEEVPPFTPEQVSAACASIEEVRRRYTERTLPASRAAGRVLGGLARVSEDGRILALAISEKRTGFIMAGAIDHLLNSLPSELPQARALSTLDRVVDERTVREEVWTLAELQEHVVRVARNDEVEVAGLLGVFKRYGMDQKSSAVLVRAALLEHFGTNSEVRAAQVRQTLLAAKLAADDGGPLLADAMSYRDACDAVVSRYRTAERAMISGAWGGDEGALALWEDLESAVAAWSASRDALLAKWDHDGSP
jgi:hypothetical protein